MRPEASERRCQWETETETTLSSPEVEFRVLHLPNRKASVRTRSGSGADLFHRGRIGIAVQTRVFPKGRELEKKPQRGKAEIKPPNPRKMQGQPPTDSLISLVLWYLLSRLKMGSAATLPCGNETRMHAKPRHMGAGPAQACTSLGFGGGPCGTCRLDESHPSSLEARTTTRSADRFEEECGKVGVALRDEA